MPHAGKPVVLVFAGHDPVGGAGIQADIEAIAAAGCRAATIVTALTVQDTQRVHAYTPTASALLRAQAETLLADLRPAAVKIGMVGNGDNAREIARLLQVLPGVPVVLDPVLAGGGGGELSSADLPAVLRDTVLPLATLVTPNGIEARRLAGVDDADECARRLLALGARHVLITGGHEPGATIRSRLHTAGEVPHEFTQPRLAGEFHGSGCTLASAIAARLASGMPLPAATGSALDWTWQTLRAAQQPGHGQALPDRFFDRNDAR